MYSNVIKKRINNAANSPSIYFTEVSYMFRQLVCKLVYDFEQRNYFPGDLHFQYVCRELMAFFNSSKSGCFIFC